MLSPLNIPHAFNVPSQQNGAAPTPDTAGSHDIPENAVWESAAMPQQQPPNAIEPERAKYPPFNPQDYINMRKPWEEEMRKQNPQAYNVGMEIKVPRIGGRQYVLAKPDPQREGTEVWPKRGESVANQITLRRDQQV